MFFILLVLNFLPSFRLYLQISQPFKILSHIHFQLIFPQTPSNQNSPLFCRPDPDTPPNRIIWFQSRPRSYPHRRRRPPPSKNQPGPGTNSINLSRRTAPIIQGQRSEPDQIWLPPIQSWKSLMGAGAAPFLGYVTRFAGGRALEWGRWHRGGSWVDLKAFGWLKKQFLRPGLNR